MAKDVRWSEEISPGLFWVLTDGGCYQSTNFPYPWRFKAENDAAAIALEQKTLAEFSALEQPQ
jgi:hypothetical protein